MTEFISTVSTVVAAFFLLSLAVETILENFRGILSLFGIEALKSKMTMDAGLAEAAEFVPADSKEFARFVGLATLVNNTSSDIAKSKETAAQIVAKAEEAISLEEKNAFIATLRAKLTAEAAPIRAAMMKSEENRVFVLRILSAAIGVAVSWAAGLNVLNITGTAPSPTGAEYAFLGYILGGLAAAGGSSFWHDQLDRVRSVKQIGQQLASFNADPAKG